MVKPLRLKKAARDCEITGKDNRARGKSAPTTSWCGAFGDDVMHLIDHSGGVGPVWRAPADDRIKKAETIDRLGSKDPCLPRTS